MDEIIILYFVSIICILFIVYFTYTKTLKEGLNAEDIKDKMNRNNENNDPCEYNLEVKGLLSHVSVIILDVNVLEPVNEIIDIINEIIIYVDFFINKFIGCLLLYILDALGKLLWAILHGLLSLINMQSILEKTYEYLDQTVDPKLYENTGMHIVHFPTLYQNRCYRIDGKNRIECWQSPYSNNNGKKRTEGITTVQNNPEQNLNFYGLLFCLLIVLAILLFLSIGFFWLKSFFPPTINCGPEGCDN